VWGRGSARPTLTRGQPRGVKGEPHSAIGLPPTLREKRAKAGHTRRSKIPKPARLASFTFLFRPSEQNSVAWWPHFSQYNIPMKHSTLPIIIERDAEGFYVSCPPLQGCYSQRRHLR
jgi:hypothetical protein